MTDETPASHDPNNASAADASDASRRSGGSRSLTQRGIERRRALLMHAIDLFIEVGYERASIREIIARAGGSRSLIYQCFENKHGLFMACLQMMADDVYSNYIEERRPGRTLHDELVVFGTIFLKHMTERRGLGVMRLIIAETPRFPEIGRWYWKEAVEKSHVCFAKVLEDCVAATEEERIDAARAFINLLKGGLVSECLAFPGSAPDDARIRREVEAAANWIEAALAERGVQLITSN